MKLVVVPADDQTVAPFGRYLSLVHQSQVTTGTAGDGWTDICSTLPVLESPATIGRTRAGVVPFACTAMERHRGTREVIVCLTGALALAVAPAGCADAPSASAVTALSLAEGDVVILDPGVWHDACRGIGAPADYLWIATSGVSPAQDAEWVPVAGGPVTVVVAA